MTEDQIAKFLDWWPAATVGITLLQILFIVSSERFIFPSKKIRSVLKFENGGGRNFAQECEGLFLTSPYRCSEGRYSIHEGQAEAFMTQQSILLLNNNCMSTCSTWSQPRPDMKSPPRTGLLRLTTPSERWCGHFVSSLRTGDAVSRVTRVYRRLLQDQVAVLD